MLLSTDDGRPRYESAGFATNDQWLGLDLSSCTSGAPVGPRTLIGRAIVPNKKT